MTTDERRRYSRQIAIDEIGQAGQENLGKARIGIVGCGALGSMVAMQLAGAGVGELVIGDFDTVDISNLQRQFFFTTSEAGLPKCEIIARRVRDLNPYVTASVRNAFITRENILSHFEGCAFLVDATDNPESKAMVEEAAGRLDIGCTIGGVADFRGQVMTLFPGRSVSFTELFNNPASGSFLPCSLGGVAGPAAAFCASVQAAEAIKAVGLAATPHASTLFTFDLLENKFEVFTL